MTPRVFKLVNALEVLPVQVRPASDGFPLWSGAGQGELSMSPVVDGGRDHKTMNWELGPIEDLRGRGLEEAAA